MDRYWGVSPTGTNNFERLWQAGVDLNITYTGNGYTTAITPWYEYIVTSTSGTILSNLEVYNNNFKMYPGDVISVNVWVSGSYSYFTITDQSNGNSWSGNVNSIPDQNTADYILEYHGLTEPNYGDISFDAISSNIGTLLQGSLTIWGARQDNNGVTQYNYPSYVYADNGQYNSFYIAYSS